MSIVSDLWRISAMTRRIGSDFRRALDDVRHQFAAAGSRDPDALRRAQIEARINVALQQRRRGRASRQSSASARDGTWHRPFTTMDLASLQSIVDPEEVFFRDADGVWHARVPFDLESRSDAEKREWIGNAVPSDSAARIGGVVGEAILLAEMGETFSLSTQAIWVSPERVALAVDTTQAAFAWEGAA